MHHVRRRSSKELETLSISAWWDQRLKRVDKWTRLIREVLDPAPQVLRRLGIDQRLRTPIDHAGSARNLVFVITAFTDDLQPAFEAIRSAARKVGLDACRVKDVTGDYRITGQILKMIQEARFIVADLTHERPNVYFELGFARGLGKTVVTIVKGDTVPHFDVQDWTYLKYFDSRPLETELVDRFTYEIGPLNQTEPGQVERRR
jgi:hypothetical protein